LNRETTMTTPRDFGPLAGEIRHALENYERDELADLLTHIVRVFVIEGGSPKAEQQQTSAAGDLSSLSFSQLILHLQMSLPHPELQRLRVSGARVWVESGNRTVDLTEVEQIEQPPDPVVDPSPAPQSDDPFSANDPPFRDAAPAATGPTQPAWDDPSPQPGAFRSRGARRSTPGTVAESAGRVDRPSVELRDEGAPPPSRQPPARSAPKKAPARDWLADEMAPNGGDDREDKVDDMSDRFSMLELD
jgi:hypothetical protein